MPSNASYWKKYGKKLAKRDGMFCHYCGDAVFDGSLYNQFLLDDPTNNNERIIHYQQYSDAGRIASVDHVIPRSQGGSDDLSNLVIACHRCNALKKARSYEEFKGAVK